MSELPPLAYQSCCGATVILVKIGAQYVTTNANNHLNHCKEPK